MKIMRVVYLEESVDSDWDGGNARHYMGEEGWAVGEYYNGEYIQGNVSSIVLDPSGWIYVYVLPVGSKVEIDAGAHYTGKLAFSLSPHAVQRVYYGE